MKKRELVFRCDIISSMVGGAACYFVFATLVPSHTIMFIVAVFAGLFAFQIARANDMFKGKAGDEMVSGFKDFPVLLFVGQIGSCLFLAFSLLVGLFLIHSCVPALAEHLSIFLK